MPDLHFSILIDGSAETIFALIADLEHYDRWLPGSNAFAGISDIAPLPVQLGTTYIDAGASRVRHGTITAFEPPSRIDFHQSLQVERAPLHVTIDIRLSHTLTAEAGMTRLNRDLKLGIPGLMNVAQPLIVAGFRKENERVLRILKQYVEQGSVAVNR